MPSPLHYWAHGLSAQAGVTYNETQVEHGQVFPLTGGINEAQLVRLGYLVPVPDYATVVACSACDARFLNASTWNRHANTRHGGEAQALHPPQMAPAPEPAQASGLPRRAQPAPRKAPKPYEPTAYKEKEVFEEAVRTVYFAYIAHQGQRPDKAYVAAHLSITLSVKTMNRYLAHWHLPYPPRP